MKLSLWKKSFVLFMAFCMLSPIYSVFALASDEISSDNQNLSADILSEEQLFIEEAEAKEIAKLFLADAMSLEDVDWNDETKIVNCVTMFDETNSGSISAYSVELTNGYIIVAAHLDAPNLILEWSDKAEPLYREFKMSDGDTIVYCGSLNYYKDSGKDELETIDEISVPRDEIQSILKETSSVDNIPPAVLESIQNPEPEAINGSSSNPITNPFTHANRWYSGPFSCSEWCNQWENFITCHTMTQYDNLGYVNHCGPTAITNILFTFGKRYDLTNITSRSHVSVFKRIAQMGVDNLYYHNAEHILPGTSVFSLNYYILDAFSAYNISGVSTSSWYYQCLYDNIRSTLRNNRLACVLLSGHDCYGCHYVVCYAYTRLVSSSTGYYKTYLKIADGWSSSPRYLDLASATSDVYWEVIP